MQNRTQKARANHAHVQRMRSVQNAKKVQIKVICFFFLSFANKTSLSSLLWIISKLLVKHILLSLERAHFIWRWANVAGQFWAVAMPHWASIDAQNVRSFSLAFRYQPSPNISFFDKCASADIADLELNLSSQNWGIEIKVVETWNNIKVTLEILPTECHFMINWAVLVSIKD